MKKIIPLLIIMTFINGTILGQQSKIYIPLNISEAIENGTRTNDGVPGENYWQNKSEYTITAEVFPDSSYLLGEETIKYYNNSLDSLNELVIRLYQDIAKTGAVRDWYIGNRVKEGVDLNYLLVNGDSINVSSGSREISRGSTNLTIRLKEKIAPNSVTKLEIGWGFKIPQELKIRMGNYGNGNIYIAYWYPQMAVYDDIDGWDKIDYSGMVEFYNDFSNYDVTIKAPKGMVVWATGELKNGEQVLRNDIYDRYLEAMESDEIISIISKEDYNKGLVTADNEINEWKFVANSVPDFSFATSKSFNWDGTSLVVDEKTGRRVLTDAVYEDGTIHYDKAAQYSKETVEHLSKVMPAYPYPYSHATAFCNGNPSGGMESPMMANNGAPKNLAYHIGLLYHEIAHNYFPFMMGTNERKYAWMDEGWASFFPTDLVDKYNPEFDYRKRRVNAYTRSAGTEADLPLITPSYSYKTRAMRLGFYDKPSSAYYELNELLGDELFRKCMLTYIDRWIGKHPIPMDFFNTFNSVAGEDLSWFWNPWFLEYGYPDMAIAGVEQASEKVTILVKKVGKIPTRLNVVIQFDDESEKIIEKSANVWRNGNETFKLKIETEKKVKKVSVGHKYIPDVNVKNNSIEL